MHATVKLASGSLAVFSPVGLTSDVAEAFASLPKDEQSILILRFVLDLTDEEIGRLMGMFRSAVQRHRTSTLKDLRVKLMAFMPEGG